MYFRSPPPPLPPPMIVTGEERNLGGHGNEHEWKVVVRRSFKMTKRVGSKQDMSDEAFFYILMNNCSHTLNAQIATIIDLEYTE